MRRHATNWGHHSIGPMNHSGVLCPHEGRWGQYPVVDFAIVLREADQTELAVRQHRFSRSGVSQCMGCGGACPAHCVVSVHHSSQTETTRSHSFLFEWIKVSIMQLKMRRPLCVIPLRICCTHLCTTSGRL